MQIFENHNADWEKRLKGCTKQQNKKINKKKETTLRANYGYLSRLLVLQYNLSTKKCWVSSVFEKRTYGKEVLYISLLITRISELYNLPQVTDKFS